MMLKWPWYVSYSASLTLRRFWGTKCSHHLISNFKYINIYYFFVEFDFFIIFNYFNVIMYAVLFTFVGFVILESLLSVLTAEI